MQKLISMLLFVIFLLPNYLQAQEFENVLWWKVMDNPGRVRDVAISPDGKYFLSLTDKLQMWDANNGDFIMDFEIDSYIRGSDIYFSRNGKYVYASHKMKESDFAIWETETGKIFRRFSDNNDIDGVSMSNDSKRIAILDSDILYVYDIETQKLIASKQLNDYVRGGITYSPDDKYIIYGWTNEDMTSHGIYWLDANTLKIEEYMPQHAHENATSDVEFSRNGKYMLLFTGAFHYGWIPTAIYSYPELKDVSFFVDRDTLQCTNYYLSPVSNELVVDGQTFNSPYRHFYILPQKNGNIRDNKKLPYIPFLYLRDTDTSGTKMPAFRGRVAHINTKDTIGVFLPPWNKTKVKEKEEIKEDKIYPNPSTNTAEISFSLAKAEDIRVLIYDNSGRVIQTLHQGLLEAGEHTFSWDCSNVSAGKYICNIRGNSVFKSMKVMVAR